LGVAGGGKPVHDENKCLLLPPSIARIAVALASWGRIAVVPLINNNGSSPMDNYTAAMAMVLARRAAMRQIKQQRKRLGQRQPLPHSVLSQMAMAHLEQHPQLLAEATASPIIQELCRRR
jgi:hypothetical protein